MNNFKVEVPSRLTWGGGETKVIKLNLQKENLWQLFSFMLNLGKQ